jgi:hypothetical protein
MDPFLGWFVGLIVRVQEIFVLPWLPLAGPVQDFSSLYAISIPLSPRQASWAGSRAGSPVS